MRKSAPVLSNLLEPIATDNLHIDERPKHNITFTTKQSKISNVVSQHLPYTESDNLFKSLQIESIKQLRH